MTGYIGDYSYPSKKVPYLCILAGLISGAIPFIRALHWIYIMALLGMAILGTLLIYRYDWIEVLSVLLLFVALMEPAPSDILFVLLFIVGILKGDINFNWVRNHRLLILGLTAFALFNTLQIFYVPDIVRGIRYYFITIYLLLFSLFTAAYTLKKGPKNILRAYILSGTLSAILGISGYFGLFPSVFLYDKYRIMALFKDPNVLGPFMIPVILMTIDDISKRELIGGRGYIHGLIIAINTLGVVATFSRGAWVNLAVSLFIYLIINIPKLKGLNYKKILVYGISIILIILPIWFFSIGEEYKDFLFGRISLQSYDKGRFFAQTQGVMLGLFNFFGYGPGQFEYRLTHEAGILFSAHNLYIRLLVENGIPGFIAFMGSLALVLKGLIEGLKTPRKLWEISEGALISILFGIMVNSIVIDTLHWRHFWFFIGLGIGNIAKGVIKDYEDTGSEKLDRGRAI